MPIQEYCLLWGRMAHMALLPMVRAHLPTYKAQGSSFLDLLYTCVIVVHSYLQLRLIRHEWGVSFFNVGASLKNYSRRLKEQSRASPSALEWTNCLRAWNKILPHNACKRLS